MSCPTLTFNDIAYTFATGSSDDVVNLPASSAGDLLVLFEAGAGLDFATIAAAYPSDYFGWGIVSASSSVGGFLILFRPCDGTEGSTTSGIFGGDAGEDRLYAVACYTPDSALPPINSYSYGIGTPWWDGISIGAGSPDDPEPDDSDIYNTSSGSPLFYLRSQSECGKVFIAHAMFVYGTGITFTGFDPFSVGFGTLRGTPDIETGVAVAVADGASSSPNNTDELDFQWHVDSGAWTLDLEFALSCADPCGPTGYLFWGG